MKWVPSIDQQDAPKKSKRILFRVCYRYGNANVVKYSVGVTSFFSDPIHWMSCLDFAKVVEHVCPHVR